MSEAEREFREAAFRFITSGRRTREAAFPYEDFMQADLLLIPIAGGVLITLDSDSPPFYVLTFTSREPEFTVRFVFINDRRHPSDLRLWYGAKGVKAELGRATLNLLREQGFAGVPLRANGRKI
jgi:hypothetical protein